jgi:hypothetical protein
MEVNERLERGREAEESTRVERRGRKEEICKIMRWREVARDGEDGDRGDDNGRRWAREAGRKIRVQDGRRARGGL